MEITYKNKKAEEQFCSKYKKKWKYPDLVKKKLEATENYIMSAASILDIISYPPFHFHGLQGERKGEWSIWLGNTGYRVTMILLDNDYNALLEGDVLAKGETIKIVCITEVSNHYE